MKTDRGNIALALAYYATADICLIQMNPADPWIAALRIGIIALFSSVCLYGFSLLVHGSFSKRAVSVGSFSPAINKIIQNLSILVCVLLLSYSIESALPFYTDHHSIKGWTSFVNVQTKIIERVEGSDAAAAYWCKCAHYLAGRGASFERKGDFKRALDYYSEYKKLGDDAECARCPVDNVLGRICDLIGDYKTADVHYSFLSPGVDENCKKDTCVSHGQLLRMFRFVPEEILLAEFPWAENVAADKNASAFDVGEIYELVPFSKLDDFQRRLLRPAFHSDMLNSHSAEGK